MYTDPQQLHVSDLVHVFQSKNLNSHSIKKKLDNWWFGPYRIHKVPEDSIFYKLKELDGTHLKATFTGNRLKCFFSYVELDTNRVNQYKVIRVQNVLNDDKVNILILENLKGDLKII